MGMISARQKSSIIPLFRNLMKKVFVKGSAQTSIENLPNELLVQIFRELCASDRSSIGRVCKRFSQMIDNLGYITKDTAQVHVDFVNQVLLVVWTDATDCAVCMNGDLPQNKGLKVAGRSILLKPFPANLYSVVRNVGDKWMTLIWTHLTIMKRELAQSVLPFLRIIFPPDIEQFIPQLIKLCEIKTDVLTLCRRWKEDEPVDLPEEFYPLLKNSNQFSVGFYIPLQTMVQLDVKRIYASLQDTMSVFLIQQFMAGSFSMKASNCCFSIKGDLQLFLNEALQYVHGVVDVESQPSESDFYLPLVLQPDGYEYHAIVSPKEATIDIIRKC